jgi:transposase
MEHPPIFSATLGLSYPWQIQAVTFAKVENRLDISIVYTHGSPLICPTCGVAGKCCSEENEIWFHEDFFKYETYLHVRVPRLECSCCGILPIERPWSRVGSRFILMQ